MAKHSSKERSDTTDGITALFRSGALLPLLYGSPRWAVRCQRQHENVDFRRKGMSFFAGQYTSVFSLNHHIICRLETRQALIYQLVLGLTGENGMYNDSKAVHVYPPFFDITYSAKNYKIVPALTGPLLGIYYLSSNFLQASGNALAATIVSVLRQGIILIPALYLMHALLRFTGIAAGHTVADITAAAIALTVCLLEYRKLIRNEEKLVEEAEI